MMTQLFPGAPTDFQGTLTITSNVPVAALTLRLTINERGETIYSTLPLADLNHPPAGPLFLPQFVNGAGYRTQIIVLDTSETGGMVRILLFNETGVPL